MASYYQFNHYNDFDSSIVDNIENVSSSPVTIMADNAHTTGYHGHENISIVNPANQALTATHHLDHQNSINDGIALPSYMNSHAYCASIMSQPNDMFCQGVNLDSFQQHSNSSPCLSANLSFNDHATTKIRQRKASRLSKSAKDPVFQSSIEEPHPCKTRKRQVPSPGLSDHISRVFIWDLDETAIIFQSLLSGEYARKHGKDIQRCVNLGLEMEDFIFYLCDNYFFFRDLEENDQMHINELYNEDIGYDLSNYDFINDGLATVNAHLGFASTASTLKGSSEWLKKISLRYMKIKDLFTTNQNSIESLFPANRYDRWLRLRCNIEDFTDSWTSLSHQALSQISRRNDCVNILVTSTHLVAALAKLMLFGLTSSFTIDNIYSAAKSGKELCFENIARKFDRKTTFIVIGDGHEEEGVAKNMNWPFWRVDTHSDLIALNHALENDFM